MKTAEIKKSPLEIALDFAEKFQSNYPAKPLHQMMQELAEEIKEYASQPVTEPVISRKKIENIVNKVLVPSGYKTIHIGTSHEVSNSQFLYKKTVGQLIVQLTSELSGGKEESNKVVCARMYSDRLHAPCSTCYLKRECTFELPIKPPQPEQEEEYDCDSCRYYPCHEDTDKKGSLNNKIKRGLCGNRYTQPPQPEQKPSDQDIKKYFKKILPSANYEEEVAYKIEGAKAMRDNLIK